MILNVRIHNFILYEWIVCVSKWHLRVSFIAIVGIGIFLDRPKDSENVIEERGKNINKLDKCNVHSALLLHTKC
jgi:hypothetical protein